MDAKTLTLKTFRDGLLAKDFSAREVVAELYKDIETRDGEIGAYLSLTKDAAYAAAEAADLAVAKGEGTGPLAGAPIALKDNMLMLGSKTTSASKLLEEYESAYDATVVAKLKAAGAAILGKTNLDEFAMGSSTESSALKTTRNPHDLSRVPGGSSGGSAAAVAAGMALAALGSDTGGSIRQPAALCGVVGFKPTYGAVSRFGLTAMASSLDQIGPFAKTVEDAHLLFNAIRGADVHDATTRDFRHAPTREEIKKLRIGVPKEYFVDGMDPLVRAGVESAIAKLKALGFSFKEISLPHTKHALSTYYIVMPAEVSTNLARLDGVRYCRAEGCRTLADVYERTKTAGFGAETRRRVLLGAFVLSSGYHDAYYSKAQKVRRLIQKDFDDAFEEVDVVLSPVTPTTAFKFGEKTADPVSMYLSDIFTMTANLAGIPALALPVKSYAPGCGELPVGFQLMGRRFRDADLFGIGEMYENA